MSATDGIPHIREATQALALAEWRAYRDSLTADEVTRVYAEMTGWFAHRDPLTLLDFVAMQRARAASLAAAEAEIEAEETDDEEGETP